MSILNFTSIMAFAAVLMCCAAPASSLISTDKPQFTHNLAKTAKLEGMVYARARTVVLGYGWKPFRGGCEGAGVDQATCSVFPEIQNCSGTGVGYCDMAFEKSGKCLTIVTTGGPPVQRGASDTRVDGVRFARGACTRDTEE